MRSSQRKELVPCSDGAGEIVAVGEEIKRWKVGDRVCPNFALDHVYGDMTEEIKATGLGGHVDGVLREYINVPGYVRAYSRGLHCTDFLLSLLCAFRTTCRMRRLPRFRKFFVVFDAFV